MQLIRSNRPEQSLSSNRPGGWLSEPFGGSSFWTRPFDFDALFNDLLPTNRLSADMFEDEDAYHVRLELPGVKKRDLKLEVENAVMTVSYEKTGDGDDGEHSERYSRSFSMPDGVESDKVSARLQDGILQIDLPKAEQRKPRTITVQ